MTPCALCSNDYQKLLQKRSDELERVMIEHVRDGYEEPLPDNLHSAVVEDTYAEAKRQNKILQLNQKKKIFSANPRLRRVKLITKAHYALSSVLRKIQPSPSSARISVGTVEEEGEGEEDKQQSQPPQSQPQSQSPLLPPEEDDEVNSTQSSFKFKPRFQHELSMESSASASAPSTPAAATAELNPSSSSVSFSAKRQNSLAKAVRKISSFSRNSRIPFTKFYPNAPILSIRPLSEVCFCCIIHAAWFHNWKRYIQSGLFEDVEYPILEPGPISNYSLLKHSSRYSKHYQATRRRAQAAATAAAASQSPQPNLLTTGDGISSPHHPSAAADPVPIPLSLQHSGAPLASLPSVVMNHHLKPDLHLHSDYLVVSPNVWKLLHEIYGGGPAIYREETSIYSLEYEENGTPCRHHPAPVPAVPTSHSNSSSLPRPRPSPVR
jgi:hypothetical protein